MSILLIGFMGAGKSTVGKALGEAVGKPFCDLDQLIEESCQMTIPELFNQKGESAFRQAETKALKKVLQKDLVIACGGGIVLESVNQELLVNHPKVVYLQAKPEALFHRIQQDEKNIRPLADEKSIEELQTILKSRLPLYESAASIQVDTSGKSPERITAEILERLGAL